MESSACLSYLVLSCAEKLPRTTHCDLSTVTFVHNIKTNDSSLLIFAHRACISISCLANLFFLGGITFAYTSLFVTY